jgi:hypothetical protein
MRKPGKSVVHRGRHQRDGLGRERRMWEVFHALGFPGPSLRNLSINPTNRGGRRTGSWSWRVQILSPISLQIAA